MSDQYKFTFDETNTSVLAMFEVERRKIKAEKIAGSTFDVQTGINDLGAESVISVSQSKLKKGYVETSIFTDQDGNGLFQEAFEIEVATSATSVNRLEKHQFSFDELGNIASDLKLGKRGWKAERIDADEDYSIINLDGVDYVVKTEMDRNEIEFELFRDDNLDGIWTKVAEGEASFDYIDQVTGSIDLIGIQGYLEASAGLIA